MPTVSAATDMTSSPATAIDGDDEVPNDAPREDPPPVHNSSTSGSHTTKTNPPPAATGFSANHPLFAARTRGLRTRIMRFTPSWFSVIMGTGIVNTLLYDIPFARVHPAFRAIGAGFLLFDIILFVSFSLISLARYLIWPQIFVVMIMNDTHSLFLGTIPMGLVTITSGILKTGHEYGLTWTLQLSIVLWWISLGLSLCTAFGVPYIMFTRHSHTSTSLTAAWLLPVVPPITVAASGSGLVPILIEASRPWEAFLVLITSYCMLGVGFLLACGLMVLYFERLALHHLPPREVIVSTFLPLGPCGQGGFSLIELGRAAYHLFPILVKLNPGRFDDLAIIGPAMYGAGVVCGLLFWGLGIWWMFVAVVSVSSHYIGKQVTFNMGWWAFTFPLGSLTMVTFSIASTFDSFFFKVVGTMMTTSVTLLWTVVFVPTALGFFRGTLFVAPCLANLPPSYVEKLPLASNGGGERMERTGQAEQGESR